MTTQPAAIAADIGGTNLRVALVGAGGELLHTHRERLASSELPAVAEHLRRALLYLETPPESLPIGVAIAAMLRRDGFVRVAPNLGWQDVDLRGALERALGAPVQVHNDLDAAVLAEARVGAGVDCDTVFLCSVGSGVGGGLYVGGRLHTGAGGVAGEIGHVKVIPGGRSCGCGEEGCLEAYAGGHALARRARELLEAGAAPGLRARIGEDDEVLDARRIVEAAAEGDADCQRLLDEAAGHLGLALANLATVLAPGRLLLGGSVLRGAPALRQQVSELVLARVARSVGKTLEVHPARLGDDAGLIGAGLLALE
ncbi:MAG: ROK family protein [Deltaproteobacteria bacterium]|nr:ROK family protein [Deltaproteobacteria bacterium]